MDMTTERRDGVLAASVSGRMDRTNSKDFTRAIRAALAEGDHAVILDLERLSYISSAGLSAILMAAKALSGRATDFSVCSLPAPIKEVFEVSGFHKIIKLHATRHDALAAVAR